MPAKTSRAGKASPKSPAPRTTPKTAAKKARNAAKVQLIPIDELSEWIEGILPKAVVVRKPSGAMYQAGTKIFAFTRPDGVAMKLPEERVAGLVESRADASFLVMGTKTMREWLMVRYSAPSGYRKDGKLFEEAMTFVASRKK
jgi:hypothetical protein